MIQSKYWYAVYTKPKWEKKVAELLTKKNIENYCPLRKVKKQWADRKKTIEEPLFTSYVFVRIKQADYAYTMETDGLLNFVRWLGKPAVVKDEEIDTIKNFLSEHTNVIAKKTDFNNHDKVRVISGAFTMMEGAIQEVRKKTVKVVLPTIGYQLIAEVEKLNLEKLGQ